jgi:hypothetical protein
MWQALTLPRRPPKEGGNEYSLRNRTPLGGGFVDKRYYWLGRTIVKVKKGTMTRMIESCLGLPKGSEFGAYRVKAASLLFG